MYKMLHAAIVLAAIVMVNPASALSPMGIPTAAPRMGEFRVGASYLFSEIDPDITWKAGRIRLADEFGIALDDLKNLQSNILLADLSYGFTKEWEAYVRLGGSNFKNDDWDFGGEEGFVIGAGTKLTWLKSEKIDWGALFNINWSTSEYTYEDEDVEVTIDAYEIQAAAGPAWKVSDIFSVYGGPFVHYFNGDVEADSDGEDFSVAEIEQDWEFGGYFGFQFDLIPGIDQVSNSYYIGCEFQVTSDAWGVGANMGWKF